MIERIFIKNHQLFGDLELKFSPGLSVFTGVSGAGKSDECDFIAIWDKRE